MGAMPNRELLFEFSVGGFFGGHASIAIYAQKGGARVVQERFSYLDMVNPPDEPRREFEIPHSKLYKLREELSRIGIPDWYCHYNNFNVLDGSQWSLFYDGIRYEGSNAFPKGFDELRMFLKEEFDFQDLAGERCYEDGLPLDMDAVDHIIAHAGDVSYFGSIDERLADGEIDEEEAEVERAQFLSEPLRLEHDLRLVMRDYPAYCNYEIILENNGIKADMEELLDQDVSKLSAECIIAMMIALMIFDHMAAASNVYLNYFSSAIYDGTIAKWLNRLEEVSFKRI